VLPGVIGTLQANEALKILVGYGEPLVGRLLTFDAQETRFGELRLKRDPGCATCGSGVDAEVGAAVKTS
jgi:adenylyltransferase/sulfurtransferase